MKKIIFIIVYTFFLINSNAQKTIQFNNPTQFNSGVTFLGNLGIGTTTPISSFQVLTTGITYPRGIIAWQANSIGTPAPISFYKQRGTPASPLTIVSGDSIGVIPFFGHNGTSFKLFAQIMAGSEGTLGTNQSPGWLSFETHSDSLNVVLRRRMFINSSGYVGINVSNPASMLEIKGFQSTGFLDSNLTVNGTFATQALGLKAWVTQASDSTGWSWSAGTALHAASGGTNSLKQSITTLANSMYAVTYTVSFPGSVAGTVTAVFAATSGVGTARAAAGTYTEYFFGAAGIPRILSFVPTTTFTGAIDNITVRQVHPILPEQKLINSGGFRGVSLFAGGSELYNVYIGDSTGIYNANTKYNVHIGQGAGWRAVGSQRTVKIGYHAGQFASGTDNTFVGSDAGSSMTTGTSNVAFGSSALKSSTTATQCIAIGYRSLEFNTTGTSNIAIGNSVLRFNTTATSNTCVGGGGALSATTTGSFNTGFGGTVLLANTTGASNNAFGYRALVANTTGQSNVALGDSALHANVTGHRNVAIGARAGMRETGSNTLTIDNRDRTTLALENRRALIKAVFGPDSATQSIRMNATLTVTNMPSGTGTAIVSDGNGRLTLLTSSIRFKENITPFETSFNKILELKPVKYNYKSTGSEDIGYLAEQLDSIGLKDLVSYDGLGQPFSIKYDKLPLYIIEVLKSQEERLRKIEIAYHMSSTIPEYGTNNTCIGNRPGKQLTTESFCLIVGDDSIASRIFGRDFIWHVDYDYIKTSEYFTNQDDLIYFLKYWESQPKGVEDMIFIQNEIKKHLKQTCGGHYNSIKGVPVEIKGIGTTTSF